MASNKDAKKLAHINNADATLFWIERPAILFIFFLSGFEVVFPILILLLCNLAFFLNFAERRRINANHPTDRDLLWFCKERVAMLSVVVSWWGYPMLQSVAISLFFTTNLMYLVMAILDLVTSETQHAKEKEIQINELNAETGEIDCDHQNQEALDQNNIVCNDGKELPEILSGKSYESTCQNLEDKENKWTGEQRYYVNQYIQWENYNDKDFENEFRTSQDQDGFPEDYFREYLRVTSSENDDSEGDEINSWERSSYELVYPAWRNHIPAEADELQDQSSRMSNPGEITSSCQTPPLLSEEEADDDGDSIIENEKISLDSKLDSTIQYLEKQYKQTTVIFPRLLETNELLLKIVTSLEEKDDLYAKLEYATKSLYQYKEERDELSSNLSAAMAQAEFLHQVNEEYENQRGKLEEEMNVLTWQLEAANTLEEEYMTRHRKLEEENHRLADEVSTLDSIIGNLNRLVVDLQGERANLREQLYDADAYLQYYAMPVFMDHHAFEYEDPSFQID